MGGTTTISSSTSLHLARAEDGLWKARFPLLFDLPVKISLNCLIVITPPTRAVLSYQSFRRPNSKGPLGLGLHAHSLVTIRPWVNRVYEIVHSYRPIYMWSGTRKLQKVIDL